jgi:hypothetical protein
VIRADARAGAVLCALPHKGKLFITILVSARDHGTLRREFVFEILRIIAHISEIDRDAMSCSNVFRCIIVGENAAWCPTSELVVFWVE